VTKKGEIKRWEKGLEGICRANPAAVALEGVAEPRREGAMILCAFISVYCGVDFCVAMAGLYSSSVPTTFPEFG